MSSVVAALQNGFKKRCETAAKGLAAAVTNFGCFGQRFEARQQLLTATWQQHKNVSGVTGRCKWASKFKECIFIAY